MPGEQKYVIIKRGRESGPYDAKEIVDLVRMRQLSTLDKIKVGDGELPVSGFIDLLEKGELPHQIPKPPKTTLSDKGEALANTEPKAETSESKPRKRTKPMVLPKSTPSVFSKPGPAVEIHVDRAGARFGPYLLRELKDYLKSGNLRPSDMVWYEGLTEWMPISRISGIAEGIDSLGSAAPPPPKPPPAPTSATAPPLRPESSFMKPQRETLHQKITIEEADSSPPDLKNDSAHQAEEFVYVGFWARVGANLIFGILFALITTPILLMAYGDSYWTSDAFLHGPLDFLLSYVLPFVVTIFFWTNMQTDPGKMAFSAIIVDEKTGRPPSLGQCIGRYFGLILSALPLCLGLIWVGFDNRKQGWHDKLAGTLVVKK